MKEPVQELAEKVLLALCTDNNGRAADYLANKAWDIAIEFHNMRDEKMKDLTAEKEL